jgi:hypothetical protein
VKQVLGPPLAIPGSEPREALERAMRDPSTFVGALLVPPGPEPVPWKDGAPIPPGRAGSRQTVTPGARRSRPGVIQASRLHAEGAPMATVLARLHIDEQGRVTSQVPPSVPPGDYTASLVLPAAPSPAGRRKLHLPVHHEPWEDGVSLRREDLYGDDGR